MLYSHSGKVSLKTKHTLATCRHAKSLQSYQTLCNTMDCSPRGSSVHGDSPGKNTGVGCLALLQGIFPTQGSNLHLLQLLHCSQILYHWATRYVHTYHMTQKRLSWAYISKKWKLCSVAQWCLTFCNSMDYIACQVPLTMGLSRQEYWKVVCAKVTSVMLHSCDPMNCSPPGSSAHRSLQASILEWVVVSSFRGSSQLKDHTRVSRITGESFTAETPGKPTGKLCLHKFYTQMFYLWQPQNGNNQNVPN